MARLMIAVATAMIALASVATPTSFAHAAAAHILVGNDVYVPTSPAPDRAIRKQLLSTAQQLRDDKFPIRVAVIASRLDIATVERYINRPQPYAEYLYNEIKSVADDPLLIVMANGYGIANAPPDAVRAINSLAAPGPSVDAMAKGALQALDRIGKATGHEVSITDDGGSGISATAFIVGPIILLGLALGFMEWRARRAVDEDQPDEDGDQTSVEDSSPGPEL